jgi:hypothetical protein
MNVLALQIVLALRSDDAEKWINILMVVVLAAFWAIAALIKAKVKQGQDQEENQQGRQRRAPSMGRSYPAGRAARAPGATQRRPQPAQKAPRQRPSPAAQQRPAQTGELTPRPGPTTASSAMQRAPTPDAELPSLTTTRLDAPAQIYQSPRRQLQEEEQPLLGSLLDYDDPAELRRAILHYEILGKPLSLRDPGEHTIGL